MSMDYEDFAGIISGLSEVKVMTRADSAALKLSPDGFVGSLCRRIAEYRYDDGHISGAFNALDADTQTELTEKAWRAVFKHEREFADPYFSIRTADGTEYDRSYNLDNAKAIARELVTDENRTTTVVEIIERQVAGYYQKVVKTVEES